MNKPNKFDGKSRNLYIIKKMLKYFALENPFHKIVVVCILLSIICVKKLEVEIKILTGEFIKSTETKNLTMKLTKIFAFEILCLILLELKHIFFFNVYGKEISRVCIEAMRNILQRKSLNSKECQNGKLQNNFNIGSLGMAKLLYLVFLNVISNVIGVVVLLHKMKTKWSFLFVSLTFVIIIICSIIQFAMISVEIAYKQLSNTISGVEKKIINDTITNFENIKASGTEENEIIRYERIIRNFEKNISLYKFISNSTKMVIKAVFSITRFTVFILYIKISDENAIEKVILFSTLFALVEKEATRMGKTYDNFKRNILDSHLICQYLDNERKCIKNYELSGPITQIQIKNLSILNENRCLFNNFDLKIYQGDKIAVLGKNGIGKSCLFKALLNLRDFQGNILINGIELTDIKEKSFRKRVGYVPQKITLFDDTIYYNLTYGVNDIDNDTIYNTCMMIGLHDNINSKNDRYNSRVGEGGAYLSGGEQQKIIIARALLRNPDVLLMDEPCSNVDDRSNQNLMRYIQSTQNKIIIVIMHDVKYLRYFNKFLYIDETGITIENDLNVLLQYIERNEV